MSDLDKKILFPRTSDIKDERTQNYARKLRMSLDDMKKQIVKELKVYVDEQIVDVQRLKVKVTDDIGIADGVSMTRV